MQMDEGVDTGDMLEIEKLEILQEDTTGTLFEKLAQIGRCASSGGRSRSSRRNRPRRTHARRSAPRCGRRSRLSPTAACGARRDSGRPRCSCRRKRLRRQIVCRFVSCLLSFLLIERMRAAQHLIPHPVRAALPRRRGRNRPPRSPCRGGAYFPSRGCRCRYPSPRCDRGRRAVCQSP